MIILEAIVILLLFINLIYAYKLNRKIVAFNSSKEDFAKIIKQLDDSIMKTEIGIEEMRNFAIKTNSTFQNNLEKARNYNDDLAFITDRAALLGNKLEKLMLEAKDYDKVIAIKKNIENIASSPASRGSNNIKDSKALAIESILAKISANKAARDKMEA